MSYTDFVVVYKQGHPDAKHDARVIYNKIKAEIEEDPFRLVEIVEIQATCYDNPDGLESYNAFWRETLKDRDKVVVIRVETFDAIEGQEQLYVVINDGNGLTNNPIYKALKRNSNIPYVDATMQGDAKNYLESVKKTGFVSFSIYVSRGRTTNKDNITKEKIDWIVQPEILSQLAQT